MKIDIHVLDYSKSKEELADDLSLFYNIHLMQMEDEICKYEKRNNIYKLMILALLTVVLFQQVYIIGEIW